MSTCHFEPNRDWRARFIIKGIVKMMAANPDVTMECSPLFQELIGMFATCQGS